MQTVTIYTRPMCSYCTRALALLSAKGAPVKEISAALNAALREEMIRRANGARTYPQIFIGETHVGGYDDLAALERAGRLDEMLHAD